MTEHPTHLIDSVCASLGSRWGMLLRASMESAPVWLPWVGIIDMGNGDVLAYWSESEREVREWLKTQPGPSMKYDIAGRLARAVKATYEAETSDVDWDTEFQ